MRANLFYHPLPGERGTETRKNRDAKKKGVSIITALHHGYGVQHRKFAEAPMDLMYGFRGNKCDVDLVSLYEMLF